MKLAMVLLVLAFWRSKFNARADAMEEEAGKAEKKKFLSFSLLHKVQWYGMVLYQAKK